MSKRLRRMLCSHPHYARRVSLSTGQCVCDLCHKRMHQAKCFPRHSRPKVVWEGFPIRFGYVPWQHLPGPLAKDYAWAVDLLLWRLYWPLTGTPEAKV